jgi:hypothetical protein
VQVDEKGAEEARQIGFVHKAESHGVQLGSDVAPVAALSSRKIVIGLDGEELGYVESGRDGERAKTGLQDLAVHGQVERIGNGWELEHDRHGTIK